MITADHRLIQLLPLIDMVWVQTEQYGLKRGAPKLYSEKVMFKVYVVSLVKKLWRDGHCGAIWLAHRW